MIIGSPIVTNVIAGAPVVSVRRPSVRIKEIHFATPRHGSTDVHYIYRNSGAHGIAPGNLQDWSRGAKITIPEWANGGARNYRACFTRKRPIAMSVKLVASTTVALPGTLEVTPTVDGSTTLLLPATVSFTYPANASEHWVNVHTGGALPDELGRYILRLLWRIFGAGLRFAGPERTRHRIYAAYGPPLKPEYDSASTADTGVQTTPAQGTLSGTQKRLDHLMRLIGGSDRRRRVTTTADLVEVYWELHKGINDTPGAPPYFDAAHNEHMSLPSGTEIDVQDQWLAFVSNPGQWDAASGKQIHWNSCSCIGHVQIAKTALAAVGLFARRTWVFPHTKRLPNGSTASFADTDYYLLGQNDGSKAQRWDFTVNGLPRRGVLKLMEPGIAWENFEACMLTPTGKFLTGGYQTSANPASFRTNKGFNSAAELLRWWANTSRSGFGRRFQCWVYWDSGTREGHVWDVEGTRYDIEDYVQIRDRGKEVPPP